MIGCRVTMTLMIMNGATIPANTWPGTLPAQFNLEGFSLVPKINAVQTTVDSGPVYQRPKSTITIDSVSATNIMTLAELATFWTFYQTSLVQGSLPFVKVHPITKVNTVMQFDVTSPPSVAMLT